MPVISPWMSAQDFEMFLFLARTGMVKNGLEWGGGMSTPAFAKEFQKWTTIEHNPEWIQTIVNTVRSEDHHKLTMLLVHDSEEVYPNPPLQPPYDFVFVDGRYRGKCIERIWKESLAPFMITHDMQRNESGSQHAMKLFPFFGKIGDDCGIAFREEPTDEKMKAFLQKYDFRRLDAPSIPWHPSHEDLLYRDSCGLRATYIL